MFFGRQNQIPVFYGDIFVQVLRAEGRDRFIVGTIQGIKAQLNIYLWTRLVILSGGPNMWLQSLKGMQVILFQAIGG